MKKLILGSVITAATLFGATASHTYIQELTKFLTNQELPVNGEFFAYDFNKNGKIEYNDWIYLTIPNQKAFRLLAVTPTPNNAFGFAPIATPKDMPTSPDGYFIKISFPLDSDDKFSWVYVTHKEGKVYKLMGATPNNRFDYLDIDQDGKPDPLPNIKTEIKTVGDMALAATFLPISQNAGNQTEANPTPQNSANTVLDAYQRYEIAWMWNEEKLAHDTYLNLYELYSSYTAAQSLYNIATRSESRHMDAVLNLAKAYDVNVSEDYMGPFDPTVVSSLGSGEFAVAEIQALYDELYAKGAASLKDALEVGCIVEVTDVEDLDKALEVAGDNQDMVNVFTFLRQGSYNHYWAFDNSLKSIGVTEGCCSLGEKYCKTVEEFPPSNQGNGKGKGKM